MCVYYNIIRTNVPRLIDLIKNAKEKVPRDNKNLVVMEHNAGSKVRGRGI